MSDVFLSTGVVSSTDTLHSESADTCPTNPFPPKATSPSKNAFRIYEPLTDPNPPPTIVEISHLYDGKMGPPLNWPKYLKYTCAVARAQWLRKTMETSHVIVAPFMQIHGQGLFAVFDGDDGKEAAAWCGERFHQFFQQELESDKTGCITCILERMFKNVDDEICASIQDGSRCTAAVVFVRIEDPDKEQSFLEYGNFDVACPPALETSKSPSHPSVDPCHSLTLDMAIPLDCFTPTDPDLCRVLYCANLGDSRVVLCHGGEAIRLSYDHNVPSQSFVGQELEEFVMGKPHSSRMELGDEDEFVILACNGLWGVFKDQQAVDHIRHIADSQVAADELITLAKNKITTDSITVVVIRLKDPPVE